MWRMIRDLSLWYDISSLDLPDQIGECYYQMLLVSICERGESCRDTVSFSMEFFIEHVCVRHKRSFLPSLADALYLIEKPCQFMGFRGRGNEKYLLRLEQIWHSCSIPISRFIIANAYIRKALTPD